MMDASVDQCMFLLKVVLCCGVLSWNMLWYQTLTNF
jgi:hypothetical protein